MSDLREDLAAAIERRDAAADRVSRIEAAQSALLGRLGDLYRDEAAAGERLTEARAAAPRRLIAELVGGDRVSGPSVGDADAALDRCKAAIAEGETSSALLRHEQHAAEMALVNADRAVHRAAGDLLAASPEVAALLAECAAAEARGRDIRCAIEAIRQGGAASVAAPPIVTVFPNNVGELHALWAAACAALQRDANTPLPASLPAAA